MAGDARLAATYDLDTGWFAPYRRLAVDLLQLTPGDVVLDVGCGTGLCFPYIEAHIGRRGRLIGLDHCPEMLREAGARVTRARWRNVTLFQADVTTDTLPDIGEPVDGVLMAAVHDIVRCPEAVAAVLRLARPGAVVVSMGGKWAPPWLVPLNAMVFAAHRPYVRSFRGFLHPWRHLGGLVDDLQIRPLAFGAGYVARGTVPGGPAD